MYRRLVKVIIIYSIVGAGWILFSDRMVTALFGNLPAIRIEQIQTIKGIFFVAATSLFVYFLVRNLYSSIYKGESAYFRMFKQNPNPMWIYDRQSYRFLEVNEAAIKIYGYSKEEFLNMTIMDIRSKEEASKLTKAIRGFTSIFTEAGTWEHIKKDGAIIYVNIQTYAVNYRGHSAKIVTIWDITNSYIANKMLYESKEMMNAVINSSEDLIWAVDQNYDFLFFNTAFHTFIHELSGIDVKSGGHSILDKIPYPFSPKVKEAYKKALTGERTILEEDIEGKGTKRIFGEFIFNPAIYHNEIIGIACFARNITRRKDDEIQLRKALERYDILSRTTNDAIWEWNLQSEEMIWSKGMEYIFNYKVPEATTKWWRDNVHPDDRRRVVSELIDVIKNKENLWRSEYRFRDAGGAYRYVYARGYLLYDERSKPVKMIGALQDIQSQKENEAEIKKLSIVASKISNAVIITDSQGRIEWVNDGFTSLTGYAMEEVRNKRPREFLNGRETDRMTIQRINEKLIAGLPFSEEIINYHKNGRPYWVRMDISPVLNSQKIVEQFISIQTDITEKKEFVEQLEKQNLHLKEIARIISHEIRKPLSSILGLIALIDRENPANPENRELLDYLDTVCRELDQMVIKIVRKSNEIYI